MRFNYILNDMLIEGKKNLELLKRALYSHLAVTYMKGSKSDDKTSSEDIEIKDINTMLDAVEINLQQPDE